MTKKTNNMIPVPTGSVLPKLVGGAVLLALLAVVVKHPGDAANWAKAVVHAASSVVDGLASFVQHAAS